ncbi:hypothetical protein FOZ62_028053 [Perkinsus olseni]|uniref:Uncharacterized protein n=2 Tax=Perkinsus olseni TaxID=32597 RepID=A0A7J6SXH9_PEROL|nr:hypothetical protein FOZ62_028053 [Perkinsus olseni]
MTSHPVTNRNTENCSKLAAYSSVALRRLRQNAMAAGGGVNTIEQFLDTLLEYSKALHILPPTVELKDNELKHIRVEYYPSQAREALDLIRDRVAEPDVTESLKRWATAAANSMYSSQGNSEASVTSMYGEVLQTLDSHVIQYVIAGKQRWLISEAAHSPAPGIEY